MTDIVIKYAKSATSNGQWPDATGLHYQLEQDQNAPAPLGVDVHEANLEEGIVIHFPAELTEVERDAVDAVVAAHAGEARPKPRIYAYLTNMDGWTPPKDVNYKTAVTQRFHPLETWVDGRLESVVFFAEASIDETTGVVTHQPGTEVVREDHEYEDFAGFLRQEEVTVAWYLDDGTLHPDVKRLNYYYNPSDASDEGQARRRKIVETIKMQCIGLLVNLASMSNTTALQAGRDFMAHHSEAFELYKRDGNNKILQDITDDTTHAWLDTVVPGAPNGGKLRDFMVDGADYWSRL